MQEILEGLNDEQQKAVLHISGPMLILAGAGSGKTKTLTHRIAYLVKEQHIHPTQILAVTFTNKAANEMRQRIGKLLDQNLSHRGSFPWMGTFHGVCVRLLRQDGDQVGIDKSFVIFDSGDQKQAIKQSMEKLGINTKDHKPRTVASIISNAKNDGMTVAEMSEFASGPTQKVAMQVWPMYNKILKDSNALDFDDLISETVRLLQESPATRTKYRTQFRYIMIDEYQDTNASQYNLIKLLTNEDNNIAVVGDDWQCLMPGSQIQTSDGLKAIENVEKGDLVKSASGYGGTAEFKVLRKRTSNFEGDLVRIITKKGNRIVCTPKHLMFGRLSEQKGSYYVYLMYRKDMGYRIGIAQSVRYDGKRYDTGLRIRANQERADKMWILQTVKTRAQAQIAESLAAFKYGIPTLVFNVSYDYELGITQEMVNNLYAEVDTTSRVKELFAELEISIEHPHYVPNATIRNKQKRLNLNLVLFGDRRKTIASPWSMSRISANTVDRGALKGLLKDESAVRKGRNGTFRSELQNLDYGLLEDKINNLDLDGWQVNKYAFMTENKYIFLPASQMHVGMSVPVYNNNCIEDDEIVKIDSVQYSGKVYDLDIDKVHNYIAGGVVGHNSVYSWRGADYKNILNFEKDYPEAEIIKLEQNYRSTKNILDAADAIIKQNTKQSDKTLWTDAGKGAPIKVQMVRNEEAEGEFIARTVASSVNVKAREYKDFAVLYRTNAQSRSLEDVLLRYGIPYRIIGGLRFYERKEIKDALSYIRLIYQPEDAASFNRIVNVPARSLGKTSLDKFALWREANNYSLDQSLRLADGCEEITPRAREALKSFSAMMDGLRTKMDISLPLFIETVLKKTGYLDFVDDGTIQGAERAENVKELISVAQEYVDMELSGFLEEVALVADVDNYDTNANSITLMTLHSSKGLEFPVVFIAGMEEGIFPHGNSFFDKEQLEEERRLCYVGMTRAEEELFLVHATSRLLFGGVQHNPPSRFLKDISAENSEVSQVNVPMPTQKNHTEEYRVIRDEPNISANKGDRVRHQIFGVGTIVDIDGETATIQFGRGGTKKLNLSFAPIEKL